MKRNKINNEDNRSKIFKSSISIDDLDYSKEYAPEKIAVTPALRVKLAQKALMVAKYDENAETVEQTISMVGIRWTTWQQWIRREDQPELMDIHKEMLSFLGHKREILMARGERSTAVKSYMHTYGERWAKSDEHHAELRKSSDQAANADFMDQVEKYAQARDVILKELPSSGMVPKKQTPEEVAGEAHLNTMRGNGKRNKKDNND